MESFVILHSVDDALYLLLNRAYRFRLHKHQFRISNRPVSITHGESMENKYLKIMKTTFDPHPHGIRMYSIQKYRFRCILLLALKRWHFIAHTFYLLIRTSRSFAHTHMDRTTAQRTHFRNCVCKFYTSIYLWHFSILQWRGLAQQKSRTPSAG